MKIIIFDSSTLINFALNGILDILINLKKNFKGKFLITSQIKYETIDHPRQIKKFELGSLKIKQLLDQGIIELPESIGISSQEIEVKIREIMTIANHAYSFEGNWMEIIHEGEASCIALSLLASKRGIENAIAIDERTTRILLEKPENLHQIFETKIHAKIFHKEKSTEQWGNITIMRSAELLYIAYKKNLIDIEDSLLLEALLYGVKYKGCAITEEEIRELLRMK